MKEFSQSVGKGIELISIIEPKFKTTNISVVFLMPCQPEKFPAWSLVPNLLLNSCAKYPTIAGMSERLQELYGAYLDNSISLIADTWQMRLMVNTIGDDYALEGEKLREEAGSLLLECILHPNAEHGNAFSESAFRTEQQELLDVIQNEINNKRSYAMKQARKIIFENEPNAVSLYGTEEDVLALTPESVYEAYQEILQKAQILIYYVGPEEAPELPEMFRNVFTDRNVPEFCVQSPSQCKAEPAVLTESMQLGQSQLVMAFKAEKVISQEALRMCSLIFGGAPFSLLFSNVREKMSLCYYCSSAIVYGKNTMMVTSGVSQENLEKTREAVLAQLDLIRRGEFEDSLLEDAKRYLINALRLTGDTPSSCSSEAFERFLREDHANVEERIRLYQNLTKEDIISTAKAFRLDSVYMLTQKGEEA
ncbi:MAG: insulinase family protein [Oscillospiraceae bacterium]|nr:insulinase family protein [Oscillospiraceae bacterium]